MCGSNHTSFEFHLIFSKSSGLITEDMGNHAQVIHNAKVIHKSLSFAQFTYQFGVIDDEVSVHRFHDLDSYIKRNRDQILGQLKVSCEVFDRLQAISWRNF